ncbi:MAG: hypothetical protein VX254_08120, partial [Planctomycetota bacterium]|nr:hypothetical protein [Planctomycetota bacterium]
RPSTTELIEPVITSIENNQDVIEIKGDFKEEEAPADTRPAEKAAPSPGAAPPLAAKSSPIPAISRPRLEKNPGPGLISMLVALPLWAILWGVLFFGSWKTSHMLFRIFMP